MLEFEGECVGCERWETLDDLGMCAECAAKFDRDLIRQRAWDYSASAFGCDPKEYEALRQWVIDQHGPAYELLAPPEAEKQKRRRRR